VTPAAGRLEGGEKAAVAAEIARRVGLRVERDRPLAPLTTMRVGGPADLFAVAHNLFELRGVVRYARTRGIALFLLGRGSNLVVSDAGVTGLVVQVRADDIRVEGESIRCQAGVPMARLATAAKDAGLAGAEFGLAIPGTVGGAVWANAGAHGGDVRSILLEATVLPADGGPERICTAEDLGLEYRSSRLRREGSREGEGLAEEDGAPRAIPSVVTSATFALRPDAPEVITARLDEIRRWRQAHQPVGMPSAGSVFRNPESGPAAGALIDAAGLKGTRHGGAAVSDRHANFIVNEGGATATDVRRLAEFVRRRVAADSGTTLRYEVQFAGDWSGWEEDAAE
jgi:UDP-N-acetylmuramate dehydrogenase